MFHLAMKTRAKGLSTFFRACRSWRPLPLLLGAALLLSLTPRARAQETIGGGTITSPAVGPAPSYGIGGPNMVLVKNWHFGADGTITNYADMSANFYYHDQFGTIGNGTNYGAVTVAPDAADALYNQPVEGVNSPPVRQFTTDSLQTFLTPLNGATTCDPNLHNAGNGSFMAKWNLPNGGSLLGQDIVWETRVRYVTPPYFWFALWTVGNIWNNGAEQDLVESFGYDNGGVNTNYDGRYWHSNSVGGSDTVDYSNWGSAMAGQGIPSYDATQYHVWTWVYKKDNSYAMYVDGILVQSGANYNWTVGAAAGGTSVNLDFLFDAGWGHTKVASVDHTLPASAFVGKYYEFNYSRVYLSPPELPYNGPHALPGTVQNEDYDTGGEGIAYHDGDPANNGGQYRSDGVDIEACQDGGGGYDVGWTGAGEWLKYTVSVATAGVYTASFRVASGASGGSFHLQDGGGNDLTGAVAVPGTGGGQTWATVTANLALPAGTQTLELYEDTGGYDLNSMTFAAAAPTASAAFVKSDATTQGNWKGVYGADGYAVADDSASQPSYGSASTNAWGYTWAASTSDVRALRKGASGSTDRIAAQWGGSPAFDIDCNLTDGNKHQVALYGLDWDSGGRNETVQVVDAGTGTVLDSETLTSFTNGVYLVWSVKGHVRFHVVLNGGSNLALSGLFFDPAGVGVLITGTEFDDGYGPYGGNQADAASSAFDGNVNTFYDCANVTGFVGLDAGLATTVSGIVYAPRAGYEGRMVGGVFEGSNTSATAGYVTLATVTAQPSDGLTNTLSVSNGTPYRWLRYRDSGTGNCDVAEIQFIDSSSSAPAKPSRLVARPGSGRVTLSWTASPGAASYHVLRSTAPGYVGAQAVAVNVTSAGYASTGLTNGTTYYYQVTAVNAKGESGSSSQASATPVAVPAAPTGLTATPGAAGSKTITVSWTASAGATAYGVYRATAAGGTYTLAGTSTGVTFASKGLTSGTPYFYKAVAKNGSGTSGYAGPVSAAAP